jgi:hypothetical protein
VTRGSTREPFSDKQSHQIVATAVGMNLGHGLAMPLEDYRFTAFFHARTSAERFVFAS